MSIRFFRKPARAVLVLVAVLALVGSACGDDDDARAPGRRGAPGERCFTLPTGESPEPDDATEAPSEPEAPGEE